MSDSRELSIGVGWQRNMKKNLSRAWNFYYFSPSNNGTVQARSLGAVKNCFRRLSASTAAAICTNKWCSASFTVCRPTFLFFFCFFRLPYSLAINHISLTSCSIIRKYKVGTHFLAKVSSRRSPKDVYNFLRAIYAFALSMETLSLSYDKSHNKARHKPLDSILQYISLFIISGCIILTLFLLHSPNFPSQNCANSSLDNGV